MSAVIFIHNHRFAELFQAWQETVGLIALSQYIAEVFSAIVRFSLADWKLFIKFATSSIHII